MANEKINNFGESLKYKVINTTPLLLSETEELLNKLSSEGWMMAGMNNWIIIMVKFIDLEEENG